MTLATLADLIAAFRQRTDDLARPYLWSDEEITDYANRCIREAARRALLLMDAEASETCRYAFLAGQALIPLDPRVIEVRRGRLLSGAVPLAVRSWRELEEVMPDWEAETGTPTLLIPDWQGGALRLFPIPSAPDTLTLALFREPLYELDSPESTPEIHPRYLPAVLDGMLGLGYAKHDSETFDPEAAKFFTGLFDAVFGPPQAAGAQVQAERDTARTRHEAPK